MQLITVQSNIQAPLQKVWEYFTNPLHIVNWNFAMSEWHCPSATNHLEVGGEFHYTMAAKDNSMSFDFWGTYQKIEKEKHIEILLGDGRIMRVVFEEGTAGTILTEQFEPEKVNPSEMQQAGWQMILDNFKSYVEQ
ncbi:MAG: SRPBCC domain-containing protein [Chitinophagia bacterium]